MSKSLNKLLLESEHYIDDPREGRHSYGDVCGRRFKNDHIVWHDQP